MMALLRAIAGRRELLQLRRQRQRWEADRAKLAELLEFEGKAKEKIPLMGQQIANLIYQRDMMYRTLKLVNCSKTCKCPIHVQRLFDRLGIH